MDQQTKTELKYQRDVKGARRRALASLPEEERLRLERIVTQLNQCKQFRKWQRADLWELVFCLGEFLADKKVQA